MELLKPRYAKIVRRPSSSYVKVGRTTNFSQNSSPNLSHEQRKNGRKSARVRRAGRLTLGARRSTRHGVTGTSVEDLCQTEALSLFCTYLRASSTRNASESISKICTAHSKLVAN